MEENLSFIADMHTHTVASTHAYSTVTENARWAASHGIKYLGMTDHGPAMQDSPNTWHFENLGILPDMLEGVRVFKGMEADIIDANGALDVCSEVYYDILEWMNVSLHPQTFRPSDKSEHTRAYINALKNPHVDVISHPEGERFDCDFDEVCRACSDGGRLIEINVSRLLRREISYDRYSMILDKCVKHNTEVIVSSDAHFYTHIGAFSPAVRLIEMTGFPADEIINADEYRFLDYLKRRRNRI